MKTNLRPIDGQPKRKLQDYVGRYEHKGYGVLKVALENDSLYTQFKVKKYYLHPLGGNRFCSFELHGDTIQDTGLRPFVFRFDVANKGILAVDIQLEEALEKPISSRKIDK